MECLGEVGETIALGEMVDGGGEATEGVAGRGIELGVSGFSTEDVVTCAGTATVEEGGGLVVDLSGAGAAFFSFTAAAAS
jgi:hypothetical protein